MSHGYYLIAQITYSIYKNVYFKTFYKKDRIDNEVEIHGSLDHPNIVKMISSFRDETKICMVLEFCPDRTIGDLMKTYDDKVCSLSWNFLHYVWFYSFLFSAFQKNELLSSLLNF